MPYWEAVQVSEPKHPKKGEWPSDEELAAYELVMGVDLGLIKDLASVASLFFKPDDPTDCYLEVQNFTPRSTLKLKKAVEGTDYTGFADAGYLQPTAGDTTDLRLVADYISERVRRRGAKGIAVDAWRWPQMESLLRERGVLQTKRMSGRGVLVASHPHGLRAVRGASGQAAGGRAPALDDGEHRGGAAGGHRAACAGAVQPVPDGGGDWAKVVDDGKGNQAFTKRDVRVHDDPLLASVMAFGLREQYIRAPEQRGSFTQAFADMAPPA